MGTAPTVEYDKFIALSGLELCDYMEPLLADPATRVSLDALRRMRFELSSYDEYHLVYALELGAKFSPGSFSGLLPLYLAHEHGSVWSSALRGLGQLPDECVTNALVESVRDVCSSHPAKTWVAEVLDRLGKRLRNRGEPERPPNDVRGHSDL